MEVKTFNAAGTVLLGRSLHYFDGDPFLSMVEDPGRPSAINFSLWQEGREYRTEKFDIVSGTPVLKQRIDHTWQQPVAGSTWPLTQAETSAKPNNPQITQTVTTASDTNQVAKQTFLFDRYSNRTDVYEYDYGSGAAGALVRRSHTDYLTTNSVNGYDYACNATTTCGNSAVIANVIHLRSLPAQSQVFDAGGVERARTAFEYDKHTDANHAGLVPRANISGLDSSFVASYTSRGNVTATTSYVLGTPTTSISAYAQYDIAGNVVKVIDGRGYATLVFYNDCFGGPDGNARLNSQPLELSSVGQVSFAFPTSVSNAAGHITYSQFDYNTGQPVDGEDQNGSVASGYYNDLLDRPTQIRRAVGTSLVNQTTFMYDDDLADRTVTTTSDLNANNDNLLKSQALYDGLGRTTESRRYESATTFITTKQTYDALGRASQASNPYRSGETVVWTTTAYDALGRVVTVTTPDSAIVATSYSGNTVTATDQAGKKRKSETDALGRLKKVYEDPTALNYLTSYSYDVLDNLLTVTQGTQPARTFIYDSLKRLTSSSNPESGTLGYTYDNNGNLTQRTDALGRITSYVYDALNRNTTVNYHSTAINPDLTRVYDGATLGIGRLWASYAGGTETTGTTVEHMKVQSYDALGRPLDQRQRFKSTSVWSGEYRTQRTYNLAGGVITQTYPSGRTSTYAYDTAGRTSSLTGNLGDGVNRSYATTMTYSPFGGLRTEQFGTTTALYHKLKYNIRGQLYSIALSSVNDDGNWNRGAIVNYYSFQPYGFGTSGPDNNGNLLVQQHWVPNDDAISGSSFMQQNYGYDALNRLDWVGEYQDGTTGTGSQSFSYDRWGNRTISAASGTGINNKQFTVNTANNRLGVPAGQSGTMTYDAAGNLTTDTYSGSAVTRVYDTENRMTSETQAGGLVAGVYTYNADGQRVRRKVSGVETWQIYGFDGELLAEYAASAVPGSPQREYGYRNGQLLITAAAPAITNVALSANGATATASSTLDSGRLPIAAINGDRKGLHWGSDPATGSGWHCATNGVYPDWLQVDFNGSKTIDEINVITLQDNYGSPAEPTETMTFGTYGITAFDVQYWNGSAWVTIPNGSVTGNNKVWRKFTFSSITTSKIRVLVNNALAGYSRIVELEAWSTAGGGGTSDIKWLVADHLGTPRIIADKTGSLAGIKRHDYLPFGEELFTGTGGRTIAKGYSGDNVRQKFTLKERDIETALDYSINRYYSSTQGRFTSPDQPFADQHEDDPQSWNLYSYVGNNPLTFTDPFGLWKWIDPDNNGKRFLQWEEGDDWYSLSEFLYNETGRDYYASELEKAYSSGGLGADTIVDVTGLPSRFFTSNRGGVINTSWDVYLTILPAGKGAKAAGGLLERLFTKKAVTVAAQEAAPAAARTIATVGGGLKNIRPIGSGRLAGYLRGNTVLPGGTQAAKQAFRSLTGRDPVGSYERVVQGGKEVIYRATGGSGQAKVEIIDHAQRFLEKISFK